MFSSFFSLKPTKTYKPKSAELFKLLSSYCFCFRAHLLCHCHYSHQLYSQRQQEAVFSHKKKKTSDKPTVAENGHWLLRKAEHLAAKNDYFSQRVGGDQTRANIRTQEVICWGVYQTLRFSAP